VWLVARFSLIVVSKVELISGSEKLSARTVKL